MNWKPGTLLVGDNLEMMRGMDSGMVDLVYLDPPFHSERKYLAPLGSVSEGQMFDDCFYPSQLKVEWVRDVEHGHPAVFKVCEAAHAAVGPKRWAYMVFMAVRLLEIHRILKDTGSCWLHCDWHADGWLRALMDAIFGEDNLRDEVIWAYEKWTNAVEGFQKNHDMLLRYSKGKEFSFNRQFGPHTDRQLKLMEAGYNLGTGGGGQKIVRIYDRSNPRVIEQIDKWTDEGRAIYDVEPSEGKLLSDVWNIPVLNGQAKERVGWKTQKPQALLARVIMSSSYEGDRVFDPFSGCCTTLVSAQMLGREWVGVEMDPQVAAVIVTQLTKAGLFDAVKEELVVRNSPWDRTDNGATGASLLELERQQAGVLTTKQKHELRHRLYREIEGVCPGWKKPCPSGGIWMPLDYFDMDHIHPKKRGGQDVEGNFQLLCHVCNRMKGSK